MYSTCSVNVEENEEVVLLALNSKFHNFDLVSIGKKLPGWTNYGSNHFKFGSKCVYSLPESDFTNGFFVAVFERKTSYSKDETESFSKGEHEVYQESGFKRKNSKSKHKTKSFTKNENEFDQESVFESENSSSKDKTDPLTEGDYEIGHESQKPTTKKKKHSKMHIESTGKTRLEEILSKKRSLSETKSDSDNNSYSHKKVKTDKSSSAVPNNVLENKHQQQTNGTQQAGKIINKTLKKPTKSHKKRLRRIKIKSMLSHNKDKKKDKVVQNSIKKVKSVNGNEKSGKLLENMKVNNETKNKLSKSKIRQLRLKKLKLKTKSVQSEGEMLGNDVKKPNSGKKKKTKRITKSEENVTIDKNSSIDAATESPIDNSQDPVFESAKEPKPHKKKHKKNKLYLNEM